MNFGSGLDSACLPVPGGEQIIVIVACKLSLPAAPVMQPGIAPYPELYSSEPNPITTPKWWPRNIRFA